MVAWPAEKANVRRNGRFELLDSVRPSEEIDGLGKGDQREPLIPMNVLVAHHSQSQSELGRPGAAE